MSDKQFKPTYGKPGRLLGLGGAAVGTGGVITTWVKGTKPYGKGGGSTLPEVKLPGDKYISLDEVFWYSVLVVSLIFLIVQHASQRREA